MGSPLAEIHSPGGCKLLFLHPYDLKTRERTGAHPGKRFTGDGEALAFDPTQKWWSADEEESRGGQHLHKLLVRRARQGKCIYVRVKRAHYGKWLRKTKNADGDCPAGLRETTTRVMPWDCDEWPNIWSLDPRTQGYELRAAILKVLGPQF